MGAALEAAVGDAPMRIARVQAALRCGTSCGSCLPQLRRLAQASVARATGAGHVAGGVDIAGITMA
jgi:assimilatory nitrate reductase catalytic subunit